MTTSDVKTVVLHRRLAENMDIETADALIERLPPDWEQLATKTDLAQLGTELRGEVTQLRGELRNIMLTLAGLALGFVALAVTIIVTGGPATAG